MVSAFHYNGNAEAIHSGCVWYQHEEACTAGAACLQSVVFPRLNVVASAGASRHGKMRRLLLFQCLLACTSIKLRFVANSVFTTIGVAVLDF